MLLDMFLLRIETRLFRIYDFNFRINAMTEMDVDKMFKEEVDQVGIY